MAIDLDETKAHLLLTECHMTVRGESRDRGEDSEAQRVRSTTASSGGGGETGERREGERRTGTDQ